VSADPYAPPKSAMGAAPGTPCWREGKVLVVPAGGKMPPRCVKCNAAATLGKAQTYSWHHPAYYLFVVGYVVTYLIVAAFAFRRASIAVGLCPRHRRRYHLQGVAAVGLLLLSVGMLMLAGEHELFGMGSLVAFIGAFVFANIRARFLRAVHINDARARLKGCGPAFLDSLDSR
jgi:hypothetical protein